MKFNRNSEKLYGLKIRVFKAVKGNYIIQKNKVGFS